MDHKKHNRQPQKCDPNYIQMPHILKIFHANKTTSKIPPLPGYLLQSVLQSCPQASTNPKTNSHPLQTVSPLHHAILAFRPSRPANLVWFGSVDTSI
jgi:hypothetical protein